jgi:hypothetical protein
MTTVFEVTVRGDDYDILLGRITRDAQRLFGSRPFTIRDIEIDETHGSAGAFRATAKVELLLVNGQA